MDSEIKKLQEDRRLRSGELQAFGAAAQDEDAQELVGSIDVQPMEVDEAQHTGLASFTGNPCRFSFCVFSSFFLSSFSFIAFF